jgi:hypothetical protein
MPGVPPHLQPAFDRYARAPGLLRQAVHGVTGFALNRRRPGDDWSIRDIILHLADTELVAAVCLRLVIAGERPSLPGAEPGTWQRRLHYLWRDPEAALALFEQVRYSNAELLQRCERDAWARTGMHETHGEVTLAELLELYAAHGEEHIAQVTSCRQ